eukprot:GHVN01008651.1.p2 GENE.GHVN01008651.1~~GHVN01008651.1.p2  ORF type:complete len:126 (-),score=4.56 GHVN01008651.1:9-386(-)
MHRFNACQHLLANQTDCPETESIAALSKQHLERGAQLFHHHHVPIAFDTIPKHAGNTGLATHYSVNLCFPNELGVFNESSFELHCHFLLSLFMCGCVDHPEASFPNPSTDAPLFDVLWYQLSEEP